MRHEALPGAGAAAVPARGVHPAPALAVSARGGRVGRGDHSVRRRDGGASVLCAEGGGRRRGAARQLGDQHGESDGAAAVLRGCGAARGGDARGGDGGWRCCVRSQAVDARSAREGCGGGGAAGWVVGGKDRVDWEPGEDGVGGGGGDGGGGAEAAWGVRCDVGGGVGGW